MELTDKLAVRKYVEDYFLIRAARFRPTISCIVSVATPVGRSFTYS